MGRKKKVVMTCTDEHAKVVAGKLAQLGLCPETGEYPEETRQFPAYWVYPATNGVCVEYIRSLGEQGQLREATLPEWCESRFWKAPVAEQEAFERHGVDAWRGEFAVSHSEYFVYEDLERVVNLRGLCRLGSALRLIGIPFTYEKPDPTMNIEPRLRIVFPEAAEVLGIDLTPPPTAVEPITATLSEAGLAVAASDSETRETTGLACAERDGGGVAVKPVIGEDDLAIIDQEAFAAWCDANGCSPKTANPTLAANIRSAYEQDKGEQPALLAAATAAMTADLLTEAQTVLEAASFEVTLQDGILVVFGGDRG